MSVRAANKSSDPVSRSQTAENPLDIQPAAAPPVWDGGSRTVLNGVGVHLHLEDAGGRVLLGLRHPDSKYAGDTWHYLAGRCEQESALSCLVRDAWEEAGLVIEPADVDLVHVVHVVDAPGSLPLMQPVFRAHRWKGTPEVREPDKCLTGSGGRGTIFRTRSSPTSAQPSPRSPTAAPTRSWAGELCTPAGSGPGQRFQAESRYVLRELLAEPREAPRAALH
jgi:hypothetical protein